jgi:hypothetical protein
MVFECQKLLQTQIIQLNKQDSYKAEKHCRQIRQCQEKHEVFSRVKGCRDEKKEVSVVFLKNHLHTFDNKKPGDAS